MTDKQKENAFDDLIKTCKKEDLALIEDIIADLTAKIKIEISEEEAESMNKVFSKLKTLVKMYSSASLITSNGDFKSLDVNQEEFNLKTLQNYVNGYIEIITLPNLKKKMVINEEGKINELPINHYATQLFRDAYDTTDYIAGDVVLLDSNLLT